MALKGLQGGGGKGKKNAKLNLKSYEKMFVPKSGGVRKLIKTNTTKIDISTVVGKIKGHKNWLALKKIHGARMSEVMLGMKSND